MTTRDVSDATPASAVRYGIFVRPDARTCLWASQVHLLLRQQYGLVSAGAFAPHITLVGNLKWGGAEGQLVAALDQVLDGLAPVVVHNRGVVRTGVAYVLDAGCDQAGQPNREMAVLAERVRQAVLVGSVPVNDHLVVPVAESEFWGHISLASHELVVDPSLSEEIGAFLADLPVGYPEAFTARTVTLFRFHAEDWNDSWWRTMTWDIVTSWTLA